MLIGWLKPVEGDQYKAFCSFCNVELKPHRNDLKKHAESGKHKQKIKDNEELSKTKPIHEIYRPSMSDSQKIAEIQTAVFVAKHTSLLAVDHLMLLLPNIFPDSTIAANLELHRTKCTALLVNLVSPCLFDELIKDVGQSFYSLIVDESTDVSQSKMLAICMRYFSIHNQEIVTTFLKIVPLGEFATSDAIGDTICKVLRDSGLTLDRLIGIGVDGCSTMVGVHHSLATYFRELIPHIVIFKCVCHSLQLAASKAADTLPAHLDFMVRESYNWFSHSPKRLIQYQELHKCLTNEVPTKLRQLSATRWMSRYECITRIIDQWDALKLCFQMASSNDEKCYTARELTSMYEDPRNFIMLVFLEGTLKDFSRINKLFELADADVVRLGSDLLDFYSLLQRIVIPKRLEKVSRRDLFSYDFQNNLMTARCTYFGYAFISNAERLKIPKKDLDEVKQRCLTFLVEATKQVQLRLPENVSVFRDMASISPEEVFKVQELTSLATRFPKITSNIDDLNKEVRLLKVADVPEDLKSNAVKFWCNVRSFKDSTGQSRFENISQLALSLYSLPYSNADVERIFSKMNYLMSKVRNRMGSPTIDALIRVESAPRWRKDECHDFTVSREMKSKFNTATIYQIKKEDDFLPDVVNESD